MPNVPACHRGTIKRRHETSFTFKVTHNAVCLRQHGFYGVFRHSAYMCKRETPLFFLLFFCSAAVMSGYTLNLRLPLWSIMQCHSFQGLLMRSSASFGWKVWKFFYYHFSFFLFCLEGNAAFLIKPGSKPELNFSLWSAEQSDGTIKVSADNYGISGISRCMSLVKKHIDIHTVISSGLRRRTVN